MYVHSMYKCKYVRVLSVGGGGGGSLGMVPPKHLTSDKTLYMYSVQCNLSHPSLCDSVTPSKQTILFDPKSHTCKYWSEPIYSDHLFNSAKFIGPKYWCQGGCIGAKVAVLVPRWPYWSQGGPIGPKVAVLVPRWPYWSQGGHIGPKVAVLVPRWPYWSQGGHIGEVSRCVS